MNTKSPTGSGLGFMGRTLLAGLAFWASFASAAPFAYIPIANENRILVMDLGANNVVTSIPVGAAPGGIAVNRFGNRVYVANFNDSTVSVIDAQDNTVLRTIGVGNSPNGVAVNPAGTLVAVATMGPFTGAPANISIIDTNTYQVTTVTAGATPIGAVFDPSGSRLYVSNLDSDTITVIDAKTLAPVNTWSVAPNPYAMAINAAGTRLYVGHYNRSISVIDTATGSLVASMPLDAIPGWLTLSPDGGHLYAAKGSTDTMAVVDTSTNSVLFDVVLRAGSHPSGISVLPDGSRIAILSAGTSDLSELDSHTYDTVAIFPAGNGTFAFGNFIGPATITSGADTPGPLSGIWWNPAESGWGINFTERSNNIFAAWYTYDSAGASKWYVASNCSLPPGSTACSGPLYQVQGPRFFGVAFDPSTRVVTQVGNLSVSFSGNDSGTMSYTVSGQGRTVPIQRQVFNTGTTKPFVDYTDLWWNSAESGWGLAITQQYNIMFLAWYVYTDAGQPQWFVVPNCAVNSTGDGCVGSVYRTTGPPMGASFDPKQVNVIPAGQMFLDFTDPNHGQLRYINDNLFVTKQITRQIF